MMSLNQADEPTEIPEWNDPSRPEPAWRVEARQAARVVAGRVGLGLLDPVRVIVPVSGAAVVTVPNAAEVSGEVLLGWLKIFNGERARTAVSGGVGLIARGRAEALAAALAKFYGSCTLYREYNEKHLCTNSCHRALPDSDCVCRCGRGFHGANRGAHSETPDVAVFVAAESTWIRRRLIGSGRFEHADFLPVAPVKAAWRPVAGAWGVAGDGVHTGSVVLVVTKDRRRTLVTTGDPIGLTGGGAFILSVVNTMQL